MKQPPAAHSDRTAGQFRADLVWNYASLAILGISGIAINVVIGLVYDPATLGTFNQVVAAYIVFSMLAAGGIHFSVLRAMASDGAGRDAGADILRGALVPTLLLSGLTTLLFIALSSPVASWLESPPVTQGMRIAAPGLFFFALNKVLLAVVNGQRRMRAFAVYQSLRYLLILGGLLLAVGLEAPGEILPGIFSFGETLLFLALAADVSIRLPWWRPGSWRRWGGRHLLFGVKSALSGILLELNSRVDILMLGWFLADDKVGIYSFAALFAEGFFQLLVVLQNNYNPILARMVSEGRIAELESIVRRARRRTYAAMVLVGLAAIAVYPIALRVLTNKPEFEESRLPFTILVAGIVLASGYLPFQNALSMGNRPGWHTALIGMTVLFNGLANALLIPLWGIQGAAAATGLAFVFSVLVLRFFARRLLVLRI
jgi:O-antigen/teichoic acid export membrane protein